MIIFFTRHVRTLHTVIWLRMSCIMVSWYSCTCFVRGERRSNMTSAGWMTRRAGSGTVKKQLHRRQRTAGAAAAGCCDRGEDTSGATLDTRARRYKQSRRRHTCLTCCLISSFVALDDDISSGQRPGGPTGESDARRYRPFLLPPSPFPWRKKKINQSPRIATLHVSLSSVPSGLPLWASLSALFYL